MWVTALVGMMTKFSEVLLSVHFREKTPAGNWVGGTIAGSTTAGNTDTATFNSPVGTVGTSDNPVLLDLLREAADLLVQFAELQPVDARKAVEHRKRDIQPHRAL